MNREEIERLVRERVRTEVMTHIGIIAFGGLLGWLFGSLIKELAK